MEKLVLKKTKSGMYKILHGDEKPFRDVCVKKSIEKNGIMFVKLSSQEDLEYFAAVDDRIQDIIGENKTLVRNLYTNVDHGTILRVQWGEISHDVAMSGCFRLRLRCSPLHHNAGIAKFEWTVSEAESMLDDTKENVTDDDDEYDEGPTINDLMEIKESHLARITTEICKLQDRLALLQNKEEQLMNTSNNFKTLTALLKDTGEILM